METLYGNQVWELVTDCLCEQPKVQKFLLKGCVLKKVCLDHQFVCLMLTAKTTDKTIIMRHVDLFPRQYASHLIKQTHHGMSMCSRALTNSIAPLTSYNLSKALDALLVKLKTGNYQMVVHPTEDQR